MNRSFMNRIRKLAGQTTTEYILILAVVVMVALRFRTMFKKNLEDAVGQVGSKIQQGIADDGP
jgi:hypothetical protein